VQRAFREGVISRGDGALSCALCRKTAAFPQELEAAHVVAHTSPAALRVEAGLRDINSVRNGILLCATPCHLWYDKLHWWVGGDGNVAATEALLADEALGPHFRAVVGAPLLQQHAGDVDWPTAQTWAVQARLCCEETGRRQAQAAAAPYMCSTPTCQQRCRTPGALQAHIALGNCRARGNLHTPARRTDYSAASLLAPADGADGSDEGGSGCTPP
jgi:hypothetical protein